MASENILIVDDSPEIREILRRSLVRHGYTVGLAEDGQVAIELLDDTPYQVAVVDLVMPRMGGVEVLQHIREHSPHTDVIILTGYGELETAAKTLDLGASYYFQKEPFILNLIPLVVERMLDRQCLLRQNEQLLGEMREANQELELSKQRQLRSFEHIGRALEGELGVTDMTAVLGQALAGVIDCDAAAVLVFSEDLTERPVMAIVGQRKLSRCAAESLVGRLLSESGILLKTEPQIIQTHLSDGQEDVNGQVWSIWETEPLVARETALGLTLVARYHPTSFRQDDLDLLRVLSSQGGIALQNTFLVARMRDLATRDSLTGLFNHGHFYELLDAELARSKRQGDPVGVIMLDMDRDPVHSLKGVNNRLGHQAGDALLREIAERLRSSVRISDSVARYGGDEFIVLAPGCGPEQIMVLANRLRKRIREEPFIIGKHEIYLTASLGVVVSDEQADTAEQLVQWADRACYLAKERGRDQTCYWLELLDSKA